jgi:hypothetical protein
MTAKTTWRAAAVQGVASQSLRKIGQVQEDFGTASHLHENAM